MFRNLPNILTSLRIALVPVFTFLVLSGMIGDAFAVFVFAGLTDIVDGFIARRYGLQSRLGGMLDPFADKFLLTVSYLVLTYMGLLPLWLCALVAVRDLLLVGGFVAARRYGKKMDASPVIAGKLNTVVQTITVLYVLFTGGVEGIFSLPLFILTAAVTVYSGLYYAWRYISMQGLKNSAIDGGDS